MINLPIPKKTKIVLIILIIIIMIITFITVLTKNNNSPVLPIVSPTPTPILTKSDPGVEEFQQQEKKNDYPLIDFTPYEAPNFGITYIGPLRLKITLWGKDKKTASAAATAWIKSQGVDPETHRIDWE